MWWKQKTDGTGNLCGVQEIMEEKNYIKML
jgi:hypothetical protein